MQRATSVLHGIATGIAIDETIRDQEVTALESWLHSHDNLLAKPPFDEIHALVTRILADRRIDEVEREEMLDWCRTYLHDRSLAITSATKAIRRLHGALHGVACDGIVSEQEAIELREWLDEHRAFHALWPFSQVWQLLERVLADGHLDEDEHVELLEYCLDFSERLVPSPWPAHDEPDPVAEPWMASDAPILQTIEGVCEKEPAIRFPHRTFCFTGHAAWGKRADLHGLVARRKGIPVNGINRSLDYLVIGAKSQPCWAYSAYGRKIEKVMSNRVLGAPTVIVKEIDFLHAAGARPV